MPSDSRQALIVRLSADISRAARAFLAESEGAYSGLDEFIEVAVANQLNIEGFPVAVSPSLLSDVTASVESKPRRVDQVGITVSDCVDREVPSVEQGSGAKPPAELVPTGTERDEVLFVLTNRLSPMKVAARALAQLANEKGEWPELAEFHDRASALARQIGGRFKRDGSRRWVGYPIGKDIAKARDRFINSFTIQLPGGRARGPMALLGLAAAAPAVAGARDQRAPRTKSRARVGLTEAGWRFATMPSPVFGECEGHALSSAEAALLVEQMLLAPKERQLVGEFLSAVRRSGGVQQRLDELIAAREPDKSADLLVAERAAMIGRLADLQLIQQEGRGPEARVELSESGLRLQKKLQTEQQRHG